MTYQDALSYIDKKLDLRRSQTAGIRTQIEYRIKDLNDQIEQLSLEEDRLMKCLDESESRLWDQVIDNLFEDHPELSLPNSVLDGLVDKGGNPLELRRAVLKHHFMSIR